MGSHPAGRRAGHPLDGAPWGRAAVRSGWSAGERLRSAPTSVRSSAGGVMRLSRRRRRRRRCLVPRTLLLPLLQSLWSERCCRRSTGAGGRATTTRHRPLSTACERMTHRRLRSVRCAPSPDVSALVSPALKTQQQLGLPWLVAHAWPCCRCRRRGGFVVRAALAQTSRLLHCRVLSCCGRSLERRATRQTRRWTRRRSMRACRVAMTRAAAPAARVASWRRPHHGLRLLPRQSQQQQQHLGTIMRRRALVRWLLRTSRQARRQPRPPPLCSRRHSPHPNCRAP